MKKKAILTSFSDYRDAELDALGKAVDLAMTGNPLFPELAPDVATVHDASLAYSLALAARATGDSRTKTVKDDARITLIKALRVLGVRINLAADGDEAMLRTTGYPLAGSGAPKGRLPKPEDFNIRHEAGHGNMRLSVNPIDGAKSYQFQYTKAPVTAASIWTTCVSSCSFCHISGLESRMEYVFRVAAVGSDPTSIFSDEISANTV